MTYKRGYFEIGIYHIKSEVNIGTLWRSAYQLGASGIFTIGKRYNSQSSDTYNSTIHIPLRHYLHFNDLLANRPIGARLVGVEMGGLPLSDFSHPQQAIYLLGAEDHGLPNSIMEKCDMLVSLEAIRTLSYNVAVAGSLIMYHRTYGKWYHANGNKPMTYGNLYRYDKDTPLTEQVTAAVQHFERKHRDAPTAIWLHPDNAPDTKTIAGLKVVANSRVGTKTFEIVVDKE